MDTVVHLSISTIGVIVLIALIIGMFVGAGLGRGGRGGSYR